MNSARKRVVALAGNPNTGKSSLFNALTGLRARVGNYPGVTVDRQSGNLHLAESGDVEVVDIPGTYSLTARSREEQIAIGAICGLNPFDPPDAVIVVVDATQLTRNLYLALQIIETDVPVIVALTMVDLLNARGEHLDVQALVHELGVDVIAVTPHNTQGLDKVKSSLDSILAHPERGRPGPRWAPTSKALNDDIDAVALHLPQNWNAHEPRRRRALSLWALLSLDEHDEFSDIPPSLREAVSSRRKKAAEDNRNIESEVIAGRYAWIDLRCSKVISQQSAARRTLTDRIDRVVLHPTIGLTIFLGAMALVFQSLFFGADPIVSAIEWLIGHLKQWVVETLPSGLVTEFIGNALIEGVGSVVVFLPQIMLLFFFIGVMEDTGYMARVAFLMDRLMKSIGLHGRAFIPMMSGLACAVPAILATRTMERKRDRMLVMLVVPLMTCSARLPVYGLIIAALFPPRYVLSVVPIQGLLLVGMYLFSTIVALIVAAVLSRTVFRGRPVPLLLEMPPYRSPRWPSIWAMMWQKSRVFLTEAGTMILLFTAIMWVLLSFPRSAERQAQHALERSHILATVDDEEVRTEKLEAIDRSFQARELELSFAGQVGHAIEPVLKPLGFDWKIGVGLLGAFAAREVFISTLGVVYGMGADVDETSVGLRERLKSEVGRDGKPLYSPLMGLSLMVFFALACQCMSTIAAVRRETKSWRWPAFLFSYTLVLAWLAAFVVYQGGTLLSKILA